MLAGQGLAVGCQAFYFILIGRALGSREYGAFVGVASLITVLAQFSALGMEVILVRDVSRDRARFATSWGLALEFGIAGFVAITAVAMALGHFILPAGVRPLIPLIALSDVLFAKLALLASRAFQAVDRFSECALLTFLTNLSRALVAAALYAWTVATNAHPTAYTWTRIYWISSLSVAVIALAMVSTRIGLPKWQPISWRHVTDGFSFSLSNSTVSIYNDIDKTVLVSMGQVRAAGIYAAAYRIVDVASVPLYSVYAAATPEFFREGAKSVSAAVRLAKRLLGKTALLTSAAGVCMFAGASLLPRVLGPSFTESVSALRWLCLLPLIRCFHYAAGATITGSASQWIRTWQQLAVAGLNVVLNLVLIPVFSWQGAAAASLITDGSLAAMNWVCVGWLTRREASALAREQSGTWPGCAECQ